MFTQSEIKFIQDEMLSLLDATTESASKENGIDLATLPANNFDLEVGKVQHAQAIIRKIRNRDLYQAEVKEEKNIKPDSIPDTRDCAGK